MSFGFFVKKVVVSQVVRQVAVMAASQAVQYGLNSVNEWVSTKLTNMVA